VGNSPYFNNPKFYELSMTPDFCAKLFKKTYGYNELSVKEIPQLNFLINDLNCQDNIKDSLVDVSGGYFYTDLKNCHYDSNVMNGCKLKVIPGILSPLDGIAIPSFMSSTYNVNVDYWNDFSQGKSKSKIKKYRRHIDMVDNFYESTLLPLDCICDNGLMALDIFNELHLDNINKYGHGKNVWGLDVLNLCASEEELDFRVYLIKNIVTGEYVRAILVELSHETKTAKLLAQGQLINYNANSKINLYRDTTVKLMHFLTVELNIMTIWLGRGMPVDKYRMGANFFEVVNTIICSNDSRLTNFFTKVSAHHREIIKEQTKSLIDCSLPSSLSLK